MDFNELILIVFIDGFFVLSFTIEDQGKLIEIEAHDDAFRCDLLGTAVL